MFLNELKLWNFRKYGNKTEDKIDDSKPHLCIKFNVGLNVLVGENNSGKTAIVDAIKLLLNTQSFEYNRLDEVDFFSFKDESGKLLRKTELKIECVFRGFEHKDAASFLEWLGFDETGNHYLRIWLYAFIKDNKIVPDIKAGPDSEGILMDGPARDLLRVIYLKPLRDADAELSPGNRSRLAQILRNDSTFRVVKDASGKEKPHPLESYITRANDLIEEFFNAEELSENAEYKIEEKTKGGKSVKERVVNYINDFTSKGDCYDPKFEISKADLLGILKSLSLGLEENKTGLGLLNQLYIAAELILLKREEQRGLKLCLIEEIEAHLHPQAQLRMISFLKKEENKEQFILTTHSTTLASKINLENLILCCDDKIFSLAKGNTELEEDDYNFLERFLDATKANLFFAKGVLVVEGDAENILLPAIAELLDRDLHKYGVSIVNVGSKALLRYAKILMKKGKISSPLKVSIVTDLDITQDRDNAGNIKTKKRKPTNRIPNIQEEQDKLKELYQTIDQNVIVFSSPLWTFEYDIARSDLLPYLHRAIRIAQLSQSRVRNGNYGGIKNTELKMLYDKADVMLTGYKLRYESNKDKIAYEVFNKLDSKKASKAVTAQWFARILKENQDKVIQIIKTDPQLNYLCKAIYHVTESSND